MTCCASAMFGMGSPPVMEVVIDGDFCPCQLVFRDLCPKQLACGINSSGCVVVAVATSWGVSGQVDCKG
jgi:hypothetical protein